MIEKQGRRQAVWGPCPDTGLLLLICREIGAMWAARTLWISGSISTLSGARSRHGQAVIEPADAGLVQQRGAWQALRVHVCCVASARGRRRHGHLRLQALGSRRRRRRWRQQEKGGGRERGGGLGGMCR